MRRLIVLALGILCISLLSRAASAQGVLPASFGAWNAAGPSALYPAAGIQQVAAQDATAFREYFLKSIEQRHYNEGSQAATVTMYRFRDPSSAYGAYTYLRNDSLTPVTIGSFGCASPDRALIVVGDILLDVNGAPEAQATPAKKSSKIARPSDPDLQHLAQTLNKVADHSPFPWIGQHLPEQGLVHRSEHYVLGPRTLSQFVPLGTDDWIGYDYSAETILARYQVNGKDETLLITSYPTQQIAADKFDKMLRRFTFDPPGGVASNQTVLFGKRVSSLIAIVYGAPSQQAANKLLDEIQYETQVTWDEPKQSYTEPSFNKMIVEAFMGTGAIMALAIAAGIGFGGLRVLFKVFLPNKVFDREKQIEILQLGISSKPINAKDFY